MIIIAIIIIITIIIILLLLLTQQSVGLPAGSEAIPKETAPEASLQSTADEAGL